jgi:hypothetical protein
MKKLLLLSVAVLAVFSLAFTACDSAVGSTTVTQGYSKIDNPKIQTKVYPGAIVVTWKPVKDAAGYTGVRIDNTTQEAVSLSSQIAAGLQGGAVTLTDVIGYNNELVNGRSYTYVITALSSVNVGMAGTGASGSITPSTTTEILPVLNGQSEATVKANVPADYTVPAIADFTTSEVTSINGYDWLKVSWTAPAYHPAIGTQVIYSYGKDQPLLTVNIPTNFSGSSYAMFPLIGGENTVSVQPYWSTPTTNWNGTYYASPAKVEKTVTSSKTNLGSLGAFNVSGAYFNAELITAQNNPAKPGVGISYREFPGVEGATAAVYRLETVGRGTGTTSLNTGATVTGWEEVNPGFVKRTRATDQFEYYGEDLTVEEGKSYDYALVLTLGQAKSLPVVTSSSITITKAYPQASIGAINVTTTSILDASGVQTGTQLVISFTGDKDSTYKVQFAPNVGEDDSTNAKAGAYTDVPDAPTTVDATGSIVVRHNPPKRVAYYYKVIGTNKDGITRESVRTIYATAPWSSASIPVASTGSGWVLPSAAGSSRHFEVPAAAAVNNWIFTGESVKIYYATATVPNGTPLEAFTRSVTFTYANITSGTTTDQEKDATVSGDLANRPWAFSLVLVTTEGKEIPIQ